MNRPARFSGLLFSVLMMALTPVLRGDGFIIIEPGPTPISVPRGHFTFAPLNVTYHRVTVNITDQVAVTTVDQEFYNPNPQQLEGTYMFPLPPGAHIDKFSMDINGKMQEAELLPADKARAIYEDIVRRSKDPALLEYVGRDAFRCRIFPIEPHKGKKVVIKYTQLLKSDSGLVEFVYPLNTEKFSAQPLQNVSVKVTLETLEPLKSVYCPSHNVEIKRDGAKKAVIGFEDRNVRPDTDFKLVYSRQANDIGVNLLTYRAGGDEGYFLLLASPGMESKHAKVQPKDVCFVLDTSGSMAGPKMEQAKKALAFCLANLNEQDRFEVIRFSTEAEPFFDGLKPANKENIDKAQTLTAALKPIGGTAIDEALQKALKLADRRDTQTARPFVVIFLTDGLPTIGETRPDQILANVAKANAQHVRIFSFGIGTEVNTQLLDRLADDTKAFGQYVLPTEDIEVKLSNFFTKIKDPVLSNVEVAFTGGDIRASQIYPGTMPDLFKGDMLVVFGKYTGKGAAAVKINGLVGGDKKQFVTDVNFTTSDSKHEFIPRLWATRRVGFLLDQIRKNGETKELKDEVVRLARQHGIVTPYTAYLILEDEARRNVPVAVRTMRELESDTRARDAAKSMYDLAAAESRAPMAQTGDAAVANSSNIGGLKRSDNLQAARQELALDKGGSFGVTNGPAGGGAGNMPASLPTPAKPGEQLYLGKNASGTVVLRDGANKDQNIHGEIAQAQGYRAQSNYANQAKVVKGRAFYQNGTIWTDAQAATRNDLKKREIKFNSDEYFALLKDHPETAIWLALGSEVDLVLGDELIVVR